MKKILIILSVVFVFTVHAFAQAIAPNGPIAFASVKKSSTSGIYQTDSDYLRATHVFNLKKSMFSAQYSTTATQAVQAYMGVAIGENMYLGLTAAYAPKMTWTKTSPAATSSTDNKGDTLVLKPVFRINKMVALEYMFVKQGTGAEFDNGVKTYTNVNKAQGHRLAAAIMIPNAGRLYIPVTLSIYNSDRVSNNTTPPPATTKIENNKMNLAIAPEFWLPLKDKGPLAGVNFTLSFDTDVVSKDSTKDSKNPSRMSGFVDVYPSLKWTLSEGKIGFGTDPKVRVTFTYLKSGIAKASPDNETTTMTIAPRLSVPFGTFFKVGEYVEIRGGFQYDFTYTYREVDVKTTGATAKIKTSTTLSDMSAYAGLGINIGTDGNLDFMVRFFKNDGSTVKTLDEIGIQGTYRF